MGRHISDISTMHWEMYYVHLQSGRTGLYAIFRYAMPGSSREPGCCSGKNL